MGKEGLKISAIQNHHYSHVNRSFETSGISRYWKKNGITFFSCMALEERTLSGKYGTKHPFPADFDRDAVSNPMLPQLKT